MLLALDIDFGLCWTCTYTTSDCVPDCVPDSTLLHKVCLNSSASCVFSLLTWLLFTTQAVHALLRQRWDSTCLAQTWVGLRALSSPPPRIQRQAERAEVPSLQNPPVAKHGTEFVQNVVQLHLELLQGVAGFRIQLWAEKEC